MPDLEAIQHAAPACRRCERLVAYRESVAREKRRAYAAETYWGRPVPGWGDSAARLMLLGLAPGAHGANRTGRMFTGDKSADFLFPALHRAGFASQPASVSLSDGTMLQDIYITNVVRCAPPDNKPTPEEVERCRPYLSQEFSALPALKGVIALGRLAFDQSLRLFASRGIPIPSPRPIFSHASVTVIGNYFLIGSYHPSQRNTSTKLLTPEMLDEVFSLARRLLAGDHQEADEINQYTGNTSRNQRQ